MRLLLVHNIFINFVLWNIVFVNSDCPSLPKREGVLVKCENPNTSELLDCHSGNLPIGTLVKYDCIKSFYVPNDPDYEGGSMKCMNWSNRGRWSSQHLFFQLACTQNCGISFRNFVGNVIGGVVVSRSKYPWHATIFARRNNDDKFTYICGGTLVNPFNKGLVILTAAHCLATTSGVARDKSNVRVVLGADSSSFEDNKNVENAQMHTVREIIMHDAFEGLTYQADIAIIVLEKRIKLSPNVLPACFSQNLDVIKPGSLGEVVGFGQFSFDGGEAASLELRKVELPVVESDKCYNWRGRKILNEICAGYEGGKSTCKGDSGGGLLFYNEFMRDRRYFIQGIVSHGRKSEEDDRANSCDSFSVFTKVKSYSSWIRNTIDKLQFELPEEDDFIQPVTQATTRSQVEIETPAPTPPQIPTPSSSEFKDYEIASLERHNFFRRQHGVPDLRLSKKLNARSQAYANKLASEDKFENESEEGSLKNLYYITTTHSLGPSTIAVLAVNSWYDSNKDYDFNDPKPTSFSQLVWKGTSEIGVGVARGNGKTIVVTDYSPPGNIVGLDGLFFKENVLPKKS